MSEIITPIPHKPILLEDLGMLLPTETSKVKSRYGIYECECGTTFKAMTTKVNHLHTKSCGCYNRDVHSTHGLRLHPMYKVWVDMIQRTTNINSTYYCNYGGRGITVCDEWKAFKGFYEDMSTAWRQGLTIDRINVNGNYEPSNCRWATKEVQARNTRLIMATNKSGYRGVSFNKKNSNWRAQIEVSSKKIYLGSFKTALDAAKAYDSYVVLNSLEHTINGVC